MEMFNRPILRKGQNYIKESQLDSSIMFVFPEDLIKNGVFVISRQNLVTDSFRSLLNIDDWGFFYC
ncbi:hypothetical protein MHC_03070 [Mycoplasma haemocanis str. Illinois]|uniref:Uncharacterized protein n=1 Tax=Mycoplasma haemocanis (strain Illinois) TaxID=1111676 RepID=H6N752_MYCHN|nr:hypothetical protein [Mycoplasma haemocanis]AEW45474.1 hypothetical protein MHC_03070 [Mycoplasma haemocanis str. Illinois]